jgi:hypothetical protein
MKKIVASVGLIALGATSVHALDTGMASDNGRFWSVSAALRGFYDDNINTIPASSVPPGYHNSSWGFDVSPAVFLSFPMDQTSIGLSYVFDFKYYENRPIGQTEQYDMTHVFNFALNHAFNERYQVSVKDSFAIGQEPDMLRAGNTFNTFQRISGDNTRNYGVIDFSAQLTPLFGIVVGYANTFFNYSDSAISVDPATGVITASNAGLLNSIDQTIHLDGRFQIQPQTTGVIGYQYRMLDYTADQAIGGNVLLPLTIVNSDFRNVDAHYIYVGLDHNFRSDLTGSFRAGGQYNDYVNQSSQNNWAPYAQVSLRYTYNPGSYVEAGFTYDFTSGNVFSGNTINGTMGAYASSLYASLHHQITGKLGGTLMVQYQNDLYYGGSLDNESQNYFLIYLGLNYQFNRYIAAEVGYDYDNVWGDIAYQNYNRNRVYFGVTASY